MELDRACGDLVPGAVLACTPFMPIYRIWYASQDPTVLGMVSEPNQPIMAVTGAIKIRRRAQMDLS